jgi:hypothetical protein
MGDKLVSDIGLQRRSIDELLHLVRKYRWMGMEDLALRAEAELARRLTLYDRNSLDVVSGGVANRRAVRN